MSFERGLVSMIKYILFDQKSYCSLNNTALIIGPVRRPEFFTPVLKCRLKFIAFFVSRL